MEKNGIGTDASIAVHINNICERNFVQVTKSLIVLNNFPHLSHLVGLCRKKSLFKDLDIFFTIKLQVQAGRKLVPTALGITLIRGYQCIDPDLCLPDIRSFIEQQITLIANGQMNHFHVVQHVLQQFKQKFTYFIKQVRKVHLLLLVHYYYFDILYWRIVKLLYGTC